jgi:hypothetical protein
MSGDFAERLAAVDDAIADASNDGTADGYCVDGAGEGTGVEGGLREDGRGPAVSESAGTEPVTGGSVAGESVTEESVAADVVALEDRVAELEAAVQALRGYAGSVRAVNDRVEERADAAVATADDCRERVVALERRVGGGDDGFVHSRTEPGEPAGGTRRGATESRERQSADGSVDGGAMPDRGVSRGADGARDAASGSEVPWPPAAPRAPYGEVDADDDREQPGLLARLRDAL